jgi:NAD(P)-dependent dehydrogenase (short-subunit alcohol dehydrogenase family)
MNRKIALVTGGSRGLGKDMAISIAGKGIDVIITYKDNEKSAREVENEIRSKGVNAAVIRLDMSDFKSLDSFIANLKTTLATNWNRSSFDFLVNNAGMGATVPFMQVTEQLFDEFLHVHFKGIYFLIQKAVPMINDNGAIINISTGTTRFCVPGYSVYASMKSAIETFTKYLAKELGSKGIRVNVVAPGPIETDFNNAAIRSNPNMKSALSSLSPLGRVGSADDIGGVVAFLCTDEARWINGQRMEVSGGINL